MSTTRRQQTAPGRHNTFRRRASFGAPVVLVLVAGAWAAKETALAPSGAEETPTTVTFGSSNPPAQVMLEAEGDRHIGESPATVDPATSSTTSGSPPAQPASRTAPSAGSSTRTVNPPPPAAPVQLPPLANPPAPAPDATPPSQVVANPPAPPADATPPSQVIANPPALVTVSISSVQS